ncbi:MAG: transcriptional repressor LexA [Planctomycetota bacterium]|nr:MAG: transcriptional repressor LexA [Planctomycetota bacterium]
MNLTARQHQIVKFIWKYRKRNGLAPTLAEIAGELGISKVTVHEHIAQLEKKGALEKEPFLSRSTRLTRRMVRELEKTLVEQSRYVGLEEPQIELPPRDGNGAGAAQLPLLGEIAAGAPLEAIEESELVDVTDLCQFGRANYLLRVRGDSMIEDGILPGDYVLIEKRNNARDGETVVAVLENNEATLKRFYRLKDQKRFKLQPANAALEPITVDKVEIRGVVVGVVRGY